MLEKLTIENFQLHKKLVIDLSPTVTTIVGASDKGKSSIIRAILWLATNSPSGDSFINWDAKSTTVTQQVDGREIQRHRGKTANTYSLDGREFKAFGNDVPEEVLELLNLSEINFQQQHDSHFWFCETAGEVSRQLNRIVDLSVIDSTLANLSKVGRETQARIKVLEGQLGEAKESRSSLKWARKADRDLAEVERMGLAAQEAADKGRRLGRLVDTVEEATRIGERARSESGACDRVVKLGEEYGAAHSRALLLKNLLGDIKYQRDIASQPVPDVGPLIQLHNTMKGMGAQVRKLEDLANDVRDAGEDVRKTAQAAKEAQEEFEKEIGEVCPLCERPL